MKSDVFSVILLEIVCGKKNREYFDHLDHDLLGHVSLAHSIPYPLYRHILQSMFENLSILIHVIEKLLNIFRYWS